MKFCKEPSGKEEKYSGRNENKMNQNGGRKIASCRDCPCDSASCRESRQEAESHGQSLQEAIYQAQ